MAGKLPFNLGSTLYSFNIEYYTHQSTFEDLVEKCTALGPNQGIEVVAPMFDRGFPRLSEEFEQRFKKAQQKFGFVPTCWSGYADPQRYTRRYATPDEEFDYLKLQIDAAKTLGFPIFRSQWAPSVVERVVKYAEKQKIHVAYEIHAPLFLETAGEACLNDIQRIDSEYLGLFPDCGTFCKAPSEVYYKRFAEQGVAQKYVDMITEMWNAGVGQDEMTEAVKDAGGDELAQLMAIEACGYFGHSDPKAIIPLAKYIKHLHGKFFYVNDAGEESAVRVPEVVDALLKSGFTGSVSCEFEGHHWYSDQEPIEQIRRYQALIKRCAGVE